MKKCPFCCCTGHFPPNQVHICVSPRELLFRVTRPFQKDFPFQLRGEIFHLIKKCLVNKYFHVFFFFFTNIKPNNRSHEYFWESWGNFMGRTLFVIRINPAREKYAFRKFNKKIEIGNFSDLVLALPPSSPLTPVRRFLRSCTDTTPIQRRGFSPGDYIKKGNHIKGR